MSEKQYMTAPQVRTYFGNISDMTLWRWLEDASIDFPRPIAINRRRLFDKDEIEDWERRRALAAEKAAQSAEKPAEKRKPGQPRKAWPAPYGPMKPSNDTLRDRFAMAALTSIVTTGYHFLSATEAAVLAYEYADAMLAARATGADQ